jgi:hypothetical protein
MLLHILLLFEKNKLEGRHLGTEGHIIPLASVHASRGHIIPHASCNASREGREHTNIASMHGQCQLRKLQHVEKKGSPKDTT